MFRGKSTPKLLYINHEETANIKALGLPPYAHWMADGLGLPHNRIITINTADHESLPDSFHSFDGIIGGGSTHMLDENLPWMQKTGLFLHRASEAGVPQLLNCFSHQLLAQTAGGKVGRAPKGRRFGIEKITLTKQGEKDPLFEGIEKTFELFTSHGDIVHAMPNLSDNGSVIELANTSFYRHEVLSYGSKTRTIQSHPELSSSVLFALAHSRVKIIKEDGSHLLYKTFIDSQDTSEKTKSVEKNGRKILQNWLKYYVQ